MRAAVRRACQARRRIGRPAGRGHSPHPARCPVSPAKDAPPGPPPTGARRSGASHPESGNTGQALPPASQPQFASVRRLSGPKPRAGRSPAKPEPARPEPARPENAGNARTKRGGNHASLSESPSAKPRSARQGVPPPARNRHRTKDDDRPVSTKHLVTRRVWTRRPSATAPVSADDCRTDKTSRPARKVRRAPRQTAGLYRAPPTTRCHGDQTPPPGPQTQPSPGSVGAPAGRMDAGMSRSGILGGQTAFRQRRWHGPSPAKAHRNRRNRPTSCL